MRNLISRGLNRFNDRIRRLSVVQQPPEESTPPVPAPAPRPV